MIVLYRMPAIGKMSDAGECNNFSIVVTSRKGRWFFACLQSSVLLSDEIHRQRVHTWYTSGVGEYLRHIEGVHPTENVARGDKGSGPLSCGREM